ncbi:MAG: 50S ribosomal protein L18 [bacterium]|nr:50S ribosomal protein L18 [bacterium]
MKREIKKRFLRKRRHRRVRGSLRGTSARPRLCVFRSVKQIYAQIVDDTTGHTLCATSSLRIAGAGGLGDAKGSNVAGAMAVGQDLAQRAKDAGIEAVCFDRGGYRYHGRIKALADAAREGGLQF